MANRTQRSQNRDNPLNESLSDSLKVLTQKQGWRACRASALVGLEYTEVRLKQYAAQIRQALGHSVSEQKQLRFTVKFENDEYLKLDESHPDGILITVHTRDMTIEDSVDRISYEGVFMTWGNTEISGNSTHLPFYFDRGPLNVTRIVRDTLIKLFDCSIFEFKFSQNQLCLFSFSLAETLGSSKGLQFHYQLKTDKRKTKFTLNTDENFALDLWNKNLGNHRSHKNKQKIATGTHQMLMNQMFTCINMDLAVLDLTEISFREASVKETGQIRIKSDSVAKCVLNLLSKYTLKSNYKPSLE